MFTQNNQSNASENAKCNNFDSDLSTEHQKRVIQSISTATNLLLYKSRFSAMLIEWIRFSWWCFKKSIGVTVLINYKKSLKSLNTWIEHFDRFKVMYFPNKVWFDGRYHKHYLTYEKRFLISPVESKLFRGIHKFTTAKMLDSIIKGDEGL